MRVLAALAVILALGMVISGCGSSKPPIAITLGPSGMQNAVAGQAVNVTATVANDSKAAGVTWSLTGPGALSAQTTTSVTYTAPSPIAANATVTITATSVSDTTKTATLTINLQAVSIALTPSAAQTDEQGQTTNVTATVSNDPMTKGVTWSLTGAGTLTGQTATAVTYTAPASITTASTATITATSVFDSTKTATLTINLVAPPSITTTSLPAGTVGVAYTTTLAATNGVTPYTWSVTVGTLPAGLTIAASTGVISGTPTAFGTSNFTVQVKDASGFTATAALSIKINPAPVTITTTSLPNGVVNTVYNTTLQSTGGAPPITWSWTAQAGSTLPPGLVLAATGAITGTPTLAGTFNVTVTATDSSTPALTATKNFSITIIPQLAITTSSPLPNGITSTPYTGVTLASTGGSGAIVWTLSGGTTLPPNLSLNPSTGAITGTPTTAGTFNFTVQAADSGTPQQKVTKTFTITILQQLVITTPPTLPTGSVTTPYSVTMASSGGTGAVTWAVANGSTLPGGLTLTSAGVLAGTPTTANTYNFSITATDSGVPPQTATVAFTLTITPKLAITTTQSQIPSGTVNTAYSTTIQSNNGGIAPITWSWIAQAGSSLPPGLNINSSTGTISGKPTAAGTFNVTVSVTDSSTPTAQTASANFTISVATAPLSISTTSLPNAVVGQAYNATLVSAGGNPPVTWSISVGSLPSWASLNSSTGAITGTPPNTTGSPFNFTVKATDSSTPAQTATQALTITVVSALSITTTSLPNGTVGSPYSTTVAATGGTTPYAWSWAAQVASSLPPGLNIDPATGTISGTPGGSGATYNVTVTVTDSTNPQQTASANFSITITVATLTVTTTSGSLPTGTVNTAYPNTQLNASGGIPPYTWSLINSTTLPQGMSLSPSGQITGTPTTAGTSNFTVQVADSVTPAHTANAALSITVSAAAACTSGGSESLLTGGYAILLKGFDSSGNPALVGGVLTFNGTGGITSGAIDMNLNAGVQTNLSVTSASSLYHVTSDHRGCMVITTSAGTQNYRFSLGNISSGVASTGHVIDFDTTGPFTSGLMRKQSGSFSNSTLNGSFAFGASSPQNTAQGGGRFGVVGVITFNGSGGVTGGSEDFNQNGTLDGTAPPTNWPTSPISITSVGSSYTVASNGRGTLTVAIIGTTAIFKEVLYVVSSSETLFMTSDAQTLANHNITAGEALLQSGTLSGNPLSGAYIGYQSGLNTTGTTPVSRTTLLLLNASGINITGNQWRNDGSSFQFKSIGTGITYSVTSSGRMTVSGGGGTGPIFYLVSPNQAFALNGNNTVDTGFFQSQTGTSASGTYAFGVIDPQDLNVGDESGVATFTSATTSISGISDGNSNGSQSLANPFGPQSYSIDSTGLVSTPSGCTILATSTTCQTLIYVISPTKAVVMDIGSTNNTNTRIEVADQ
jgi:hypothetical protein